MSKISCREIYFVNANHPYQIDFLVNEIKKSVKEIGVPKDYDIRVYKNVHTCCGVAGVGIIIEIVGPEEERIKAIDLRAVARILEFCEKEGYEVGHHTVGQLDVM
ncbi:MAG: hypothetical protein ABSD73_07180 [Candidatus Bathyarchaeia archaeon]|jgi:hypothetical protein